MRNAAEVEVAAALEDEIFLQADKLLALCAVLSAIDQGHSLSLSTRAHYSLVMEEHARALRRKLKQLLDCDIAPTQN